MRFFQVVLSGAALINAAMAAVSFTKVPTSVQAGSTVELEWEADGTGPITILLRKGPAENLGAGETLTTTGANGKFTWAVPSSLVNGNDYAFEIKQGSENNFSGQFAVSGGTGSASSAASSGASSAAASSSVSATATVSASVTRSASLVTVSSVASSASSNGTVTSATLSRTASSTSRQTGSSTAGTASVPEATTGAASTLITSPLALIFGAVAAMAYLN